jgi:Ni/Co efflux regulator RcnB
MVRQTSHLLKGVEVMKRILMAILAVAIAVTFSAPSFAGEEKKDKKDEKKGGSVLVYGEEKKDKKDEKKGGHMDTFGEEKKDKKDEKKGK